MASAVLGNLATSSHRTCWRLVAWIQGRPRDRPIALFSSYLHLKRQLGLIISHIRLSLLLGAGFCLALLCIAPVYFLTYIIFGCLLSSHTFLAVSQLESFASISPKHTLYWESQSQVTGQFSSYACRDLLGDPTYFSRWMLMQCTQLVSRNKLLPEYTRISGLHESTVLSGWPRTIR